MNSGKYVFSQFVEVLDANTFNSLVIKYNGNYKVKSFSCWNHILCLIFAQLTRRESLSDLITGLLSQKNKWYHLGFGNTISKSNFAHANNSRDYNIYKDFAYTLIAQARLLSQNENENELEVQVNGNIYAIDSTTIDLCLNVFWWAKFRRNKGAIKLHTQFDVKSNIPYFMHFSDGSQHDVHMMDYINYEADSYYIFDKAYVDFKRLNFINNSKAWFITRPKDNMNYRRLYSEKIDKSTGIKYDQTIKLNNPYASKDYPEKLRLIKFIDLQDNIELEFITNNFELNALEIARLYKYRWSVELFFKWIKQHLKVQTFWGTSENAVRIQIYAGMITYATVIILKHTLKRKQSNYEILQILSLTALTKTPINQLFENNELQNTSNKSGNQLVIF
jgi:Domain of unknown function (DUF4372)/Transposase DDE domain